MGFTFRKRKRIGKNTWANVSKSGLSGSARTGRVSMSSRGRGSVRLGKGMSYRFKL